jgi:hypothetical protein
MNERNSFLKILLRRIIPAICIIILQSGIVLSQIQYEYAKADTDTTYTTVNFGATVPTQTNINTSLVSGEEENGDSASALQTPHLPYAVMETDNKYDAYTYDFPGGWQGMSYNVDDRFAASDAAIAVSNTRVVVVVNSQMSVYTKSGDLIYSNRLWDFFKESTVGPAYVTGEDEPVNCVQTGFAEPYDPRIIYDQVENRWVIVAVVQRPDLNHSYFRIAVSQTSDPEGYWDIHSINADVIPTPNERTVADYPMIGYDDQALYITSQQFDPCTEDHHIQYVQLLVIDKLALYAGQMTSMMRYSKLHNADEDETIVYDLSPARNFSASSSTHYFINTGHTAPPDYTNHFVTLWKLTNPLSANPQLSIASTIPISDFYLPPVASQAGEQASFFIGDCRTQESIFIDGKLYTSFTTGVSYGEKWKCGIRYLKIGINEITSQYTLIWDNTYGNQWFDYFLPQIAVDYYGNVAMAFTRSSTTTYPSFCWTFRLATDAAMRRSMPIKRSETFFWDATPNHGQTWGDYNAIALDPSADNSLFLPFWAFGNYTIEAEPAQHQYTYYGHWSTWISPLPLYCRMQVKNQIGSNDAGGSLTVNGTSKTSGEYINVPTSDGITDNIITTNSQTIVVGENTYMHHDWNDVNNEYKLYRYFTALPIYSSGYPSQIRNQIAYFKAVYPATIKADIDGGDGKFMYKDPWINQTEDFQLAQSQLSRNVFLNLDPSINSQLKYYSLQTIAQTAPYTSAVFQGLSLSGVNKFTDGSNTGLVYNSQNGATVKAIYKLPLKTSTPNAFGTNGQSYNAQQKLMIDNTQDGSYVLTYESSGTPYFTISANGGNLWDNEYLFEPGILSNSSTIIQSPTLFANTSYSFACGAVWERVDISGSTYNHSIRMKILDGTNSTIANVRSFSTGSGQQATPVAVSNLSDNFIFMAWKEPAGIQTICAVPSSADEWNLSYAPNLIEYTASAINPSIACKNTEELSYDWIWAAWEIPGAGTSGGIYYSTNSRELGSQELGMWDDTSTSPNAGRIIPNTTSALYHKPVLAYDPTSTINNVKLYLACEVDEGSQYCVYIRKFNPFGGATLQEKKYTANCNSVVSGISMRCDDNGTVTVTWYASGIGLVGAKCVNGVWSDQYVISSSSVGRAAMLGADAQTSSNLKYMAVSGTGAPYSISSTPQTVPAPSVPAATTLATPANNATSIATSVSLYWNCVFARTTYRLQVSTHSDMSSPLYDNSNITITSQPFSGLLYNTSYWWRVAAINGNGQGAWSTVYKFTTCAVPSTHMHSNSANAIVTNSQRKMVRGSGGNLYLAYESDGNIFYTFSTDGTGTTWSGEAYANTPGTAGNSYPAIAEYNGNVYVVWQHANGSNWDIVYRVVSDPSSTPQTLASNFACASPGPTPAIQASKPTSFQLLVLYSTSSTMQSKLTYTSNPLSADWNPYTVTGSSGGKNPSLAYRPTSSSSNFGVTWDIGGGGTVYYQDFNGGWGSATNISSGASGAGIYSNAYSSYASDVNNNRLMAWQGYHQSLSLYVIIFSKNLNPSVYTEFGNYYYHPYYRPVITGHDNNHITLLWYSDGSSGYKTTYNGSSWSTPAGFGGNNVTVSINNPAGGTAYAMNMTGSYAPYSLVMSGGSLSKETTEGWTYSRRISLSNNSTGNIVTLEMSNPVLTSGSGNPISLDYATNDDSTVYTMQNIGSTLTTLPVTPGGTSVTLQFARSLTIQRNGSGSGTTIPLIFEAVDAQTGAVLAQENVQVADGDTTLNGEDLMTLQFSNPSGHGVIFRLGAFPENLAEAYNVSFGQIYMAEDPNMPKVKAKHDRFAQQKPTAFSLSNNYPNPFNPTTTLDFQLASAGYVIMTVYNSLGQEIKTLVDGEKEAGTYSVRWYAGDSPSGIYFVRIRIADQFGKQLYQDAKKVMLIK